MLEVRKRFYGEDRGIISYDKPFNLVLSISLILFFCAVMKFRLFYYIIIAGGIALRLVWVSDMEWKDDEIWMYTKAHEVAKSGTFPAVGMSSGGGIVNPGISVGAFAVIALFTDDPLSMDRVVQILNVAALLCF